MEQDADIKGEKLDYNTEYRQFDPRVGRWFSPDPVVKPWESPYAGFANNPLYYSDPSGLDPKPTRAGTNGETVPADQKDYQWVYDGKDWKIQLSPVEIVSNQQGGDASYNINSEENYNPMQTMKVAEPVAFQYWQDAGVNRQSFMTGLNQRTGKKQASNIYQGNTGYCGIAALIQFWAADHPAQYRAAMLDLYYHGETTINGWEITSPGHKPFDRSTDKRGMTDVDYVLFTSLRYTINGNVSSTESDASDFYMPSTIVDAAHNLGYAKVAEDYNMNSGKCMFSIQTIDDLNAHYHTILIINTKIIAGQKDNWNITSNHYVGYAGGLNFYTNGNGVKCVRFDVFTWGDIRRIDVSYNTFIKNYYGSIIFR